LYVIDCSKPFTVSVDASDYAVGAVLSQVMENGVEQPVAFASSKTEFYATELGHHREGSLCSDMGPSEV